jgi:ferredoxin-NADP reductase
MVHQAELLGAEWRLLYGGRRRESMAFLDELAHYGDRVLVRPADEHGLLDLPGFLGEPRTGVRVYACGPGPLLTAVERACDTWPAHTLRTERFTADVSTRPARSAPFEVVLSSCRRGVCGTCETTVLDGRPDHRDTLLGEEAETADFMYVCVSRSLDKRLVLDL